MNWFGGIKTIYSSYKLMQNEFTQCHTPRGSPRHNMMYKTTKSLIALHCIWYENNTKLKNKLGQKYKKTLLKVILEIHSGSLRLTYQC